MAIYDLEIKLVKVFFSVILICLMIFLLFLLKSVGYIHDKASYEYFFQNGHVKVCCPFDIYAIKIV